MKKAVITYIAGIGDKVRNRHADQSGVVASLSTNDSGNWYYIETASGMSVGWWHETDVATPTKSVAPMKSHKNKATA